MPKLAAFLLGVLMAVGVWYWFVHRPAEIRRQCLETVAQSDIEESYRDCLNRHGVSD